MGRMIIIIAIIAIFVGASISYYNGSRMAMAWLSAALFLGICTIIAEIDNIKNDKSN